MNKPPPINGGYNGEKGPKKEGSYESQVDIIVPCDLSVLGEEAIGLVRCSPVSNAPAVWRNMIDGCRWRPAFSYRF